MSDTLVTVTLDLDIKSKQMMNSLLSVKLSLVKQVYQRLLQFEISLTIQDELHHQKPHTKYYKMSNEVWY